jgi:NitT/TauT family transport system substrate-binding protein
MEMRMRFDFGRRGLAAAALFGVALAASPLLAQQAPADMLELRLAVADPTINPVTDSILRLADSLGYYKRHGVKVTIVALEGTPQAVAALNAGDVDVADISIDSALRLRGANKVALKGVVSSTLGPPYLIAAKEDVKAPADLVGRTFAIADNGSLDHNLTRAVLGTLGIDPDGPQFVAIGAPSVRVQALAAGKVDATTVSYGSFLPVSQTPGLHIILQPEDFFAAAPIQSKFVVALEPTIAAKHDAIQRFVEALVDISRSFDGDAASWVKAMTTARDDLSAKQLEDTSRFLTGRWCVNGCLNPEDIQKTIDFIYKNPDFGDVPAVASTDMIDESFVTNSIKDLGPYKGGGIDARD